MWFVWTLAQIACDMLIYLKVENRSVLFVHAYLYYRIFFWKKLPQFARISVLQPLFYLYLGPHNIFTGETLPKFLNCSINFTFILDLEKKSYCVEETLV